MCFPEGLSANPMLPRCLAGRMDGRVVGWMDGWMYGWTDGRTDGRRDGWMDVETPRCAATFPHRVLCMTPNNDFGRVVNLL